MDSLTIPAVQPTTDNGTPRDYEVDFGGTAKYIEPNKDISTAAITERIAPFSSALKNVQNGSDVPER